MDVEGSGEKANGDALGPCLNNFADDGSIDSLRYYLSRRTLLEMLKDRGYAVSTDQINFSLQDFRAMYGQSPDIERLRLSYSHRSDPSSKILVVYSGAGTVKVNVIRSIIAQIAQKESLNELVLVLESTLTTQAQKALDGLPFKVDTFQITDLLVNITKHVLKPKHRVLSDEEKQRLLKRYSVEEKQLPRISPKDAIARYYGLRKGQVLKIAYSEGITDKHITYRCVW